MAPAIDGKNGRRSLRRFRAATRASAPGPPSWTTGDDSDDEAELQVQRSHQKRRFRKRHHVRQEDPQDATNFNVGIQTAPASVTATAQPEPSPSGDTSGDSGIASGVDSDDDEDDGEFSDAPAATASLGIPESTSATATGGGTISSTPTPGDGIPPPFFARPPPPVQTGDDGFELGFDSGDESPTVAPTSTGGSSSTDNSFPTQTATGLYSTSSTMPSPDDDGPPDAAIRARMRHHRNVEIALTVIGSVVGVVCVGVAIWLFIKFYRRRRDSPRAASTPKPSRRVRFLAHVPILKTRFANRSWFNIDDPYVDDKDPRFMAGDDLLGYLPDKPPATAAAAVPQMRVINVDETGYYTTTMQTVDTRQATASQDRPVYSPTESSLSSAFGNGTFMAPTELHPPPPSHHSDGDFLHPPAASYRDTMYTQSSEASSIPRFRTVNSWVRQQTGRMRRSTPPPVPEQGYGFMMPDGEEPRRVVDSSRGIGFAT